MTTKEYQKIEQMIALSIPSWRPFIPFNGFDHGYDTCKNDLLKKLESLGLGLKGVSTSFDPEDKPKYARSE